MQRHLINPGLELRQLQLADAPALFAIVEANRKSLREYVRLSSAYPRSE